MLRVEVGCRVCRLRLTPLLSLLMLEVGAGDEDAMLKVKVWRTDRSRARYRGSRGESADREGFAAGDSAVRTPPTFRDERYPQVLVDSSLCESICRRISRCP